MKHALAPDRAVEAMLAAECELLQAVEGGDIPSIDEAAARFREAMDKVRCQTTWNDRPELRRIAVQALALADSARHRANFLSDNYRRLG